MGHITHVGIRYCTLDEYPVESSGMYQYLLDVHGEEVAELFTYEKEIPLPKVGVLHAPLPDPV